MACKPSPKGGKKGDVKTKFVEVTKAEMAETTQEWICEQCCLVGTSACKQAKCLPHERCDNRQGYFVEDKEHQA